MEELWSSSSGDQDSGSLKTVASGLGGANPRTAARLKAQMQVDELRPLDVSFEGSDEGDERPLGMGTGGDSAGKDRDEVVAVWPEETLLQSGDYLRLSVSHILGFISFAIGWATNGPHTCLVVASPFPHGRRQPRYYSQSLP